MRSKILTTSVILILLAIILGAFGAHGLKSKLSDENLLNAFETGVKYQMYHGIALLAIGLSKFDFILNKLRFWLMILGVILFSGSIYLLVLNPLIGNALPKFIGAITPIGGSLLIVSWFLILIHLWKNKSLFVEK